jgi:hypothetical protein
VVTPPGHVAQRAAEDPRSRLCERRRLGVHDGDASKGRGGNRTGLRGSRRLELRNLDLADQALTRVGHGGESDVSRRRSREMCCRLCCHRRAGRRRNPAQKGSPNGI